MKSRDLVLVAIWLGLMSACLTLDMILDELRGCKIVYLSRESSGDAAALSAARLSNPGGNQ